MTFHRRTARQSYVLAWLLILVGCPHAASSNSWTGKVVGVSDGDTVTVLRDKTPVKIRLQGVDAPEKAQPFGQQAKQFTSSLVFGKEVRVEVATTDKYGRTVGRICTLTSTTCLEEELLKAGLAWWYRQYAPKDKQLARLEKEARQAKRGLWAEPHPTPPWAWRHSKKAAQQGVAATAAGPFHGNINSKVLHAPGCRDYACKSCTAGFQTVEKAQAAGFRPHAACVTPFATCYAACLQQNQARAGGRQLYEAECQRSCTK